MSDVFERVITGKDALKEAFVIAYTHARSLIDNGERVHVVVQEAHDPITALQRGFLHAAVLPQIAEQVWVEANGKRERFTAQTWKEYYWKLLVKPKYKMRRLPGQKRATPHRVNDSSEKLGVRAYAKWIDEIIDHAVAEWHVEFVWNPKERAAVRGPGAGKVPRADVDAS